MRLHWNSCKFESDPRRESFLDKNTISWQFVLIFFFANFLSVLTWVWLWKLQICDIICLAISICTIKKDKWNIGNIQGLTVYVFQRENSPYMYQQLGQRFKRLCWLPLQRQTLPLPFGRLLSPLPFGWLPLQEKAFPSGWLQLFNVWLGFLSFRGRRNCSSRKPRVQHLLTFKSHHNVKST